MSEFWKQLVARNLTGSDALPPVLPSYFEPREAAADFQEVEAAAEAPPPAAPSAEELPRPEAPTAPAPGRQPEASLRGAERESRPAAPFAPEPLVREAARPERLEAPPQPAATREIPAPAPPAERPSGAQIIPERFREKEVKVEHRETLRETHTLEVRSEAAEPAVVVVRPEDRAPSHPAPEEAEREPWKNVAAPLKETRVEVVRERDREAHAAALAPRSAVPARSGPPEPVRTATRVERRAAREPEPRREPDIRVSIGRVEVKAVFPPPAQPRPARPAPTQVVPLNEYLENPRGRKR